MNRLRLLVTTLGPALGALLRALLPSAPTGAALAPVDPPARLPARPLAFLGFLLMRHFKLRVALLVLAAAAASATEAVAPFLLGRLVNAVTYAAQFPSGASGLPVAQWFVLLAGVWLLASFIYRAFETLDMLMAPRMRGMAQAYLFAHLLGHSPRYFQENFAGKLGQKIKQAGQACVMLLQILGFEAVRVGTLLLVAGFLLFLASPFYAGVLAAWTAAYLFLVTLLARRCVSLSRAFSEEVSTSTGRLIDAISNADLVRAFAKARFERDFLSGFLTEEMHASIRLRWFLIGLRFFMSSAMLVLQLSLIWFAITDTLTGAISIGVFTMIFFLGNMIARSVQELSYRLLEFFEQLGTLTEGLTLVTQPHEITDAPGAQPLAVSEGGIAFEHVAFAHHDGRAIFEDLSLTIRPGEKIGLVGHSGAGKSTLVKLLRRQFEPQAGRILIDGQDIATVTWDSLNEAIAEVPQAPGVFHRPVRDNIRYAHPDIEEDAVIAAAIDAHAHDFIRERITGYDTIVGEQGIKLSGGERQRVAIARALVKDAKILVLDEATSSLDSESEHLIQDALFRLMEGRTVIAIAHRLSTIARMDRIVCLEAGRIVEEGTHSALLARNGAYARLWNRQMGGFIDAG
ncbi:MAG: ATP-binding cassette domain-containing protein [Alphaproteobacteria bacterium]|nr:ATP-binding cassette domain-containing protein [Alphaproteobacteria bacterium]